MKTDETLASRVGERVRISDAAPLHMPRLSGVIEKYVEHMYPFCYVFKHDGGTFVVTPQEVEKE